MSRKPEIREPFYASVDYGYSPKQWTKVTRDLGGTEYKIDVAKVIQFAEPWNDRKPVTRPLGDALQELASYYGALARLEDHRLTPKQQAVKAKQILAKLKANAGDLADLIPELERRKERYDKLAATHNSRRDGAIKTHTRFWLALMQIWRGLDNAKQGHKNLNQFLLICSKPIFPKATTETTLTAFVERYSPHANI